MKTDDERLFELCSKMITEKDADKMADLVRKMNEELVEKKNCEIQGVPKAHPHLPRSA